MVRWQADATGDGGWLFSILEVRSKSTLQPARGLLLLSLAILWCVRFPWARKSRVLEASLHLSSSDFCLRGSVSDLRVTIFACVFWLRAVVATEVARASFGCTREFLVACEFWLHARATVGCTSFGCALVASSGCGGGGVACPPWALQVVGAGARSKLQAVVEVQAPVGVQAVGAEGAALPPREVAAVRSEFSGCGCGCEVQAVRSEAVVTTCTQCAHAAGEERGDNCSSSAEPDPLFFSSVANYLAGHPFTVF